MNWDTVIGLEVHVELATKSKIFCSCKAKFGGEPNTQCCPVCIGMPGTLPKFNAEVLNYAVKAGVALNCEIIARNRFDRKNYFYPDLPKAYQISQLYLPFAKNGSVRIETIKGVKDIGIHEIHMEEDAGKLIHSESGTLTDYNRCGVPLIEIVTEPDFSCKEEVIAFLIKIKSIFEYLGISDCKMQEGSMRVDVNLSVKPKGCNALGTRTEMKNLNSFKAIERAITFEEKRQIEILDRNGKVIQETRRFDDSKGESFSMRTKENASDYRYFPEPDIPPLVISDEYVKKVKEELPEFADEKIERYIKEFMLTRADAKLIAESKYLSRLFEETVKLSNEPKEVRYWILNQIMYLMNEKGIKAEDIKLSPEKFTDFIKISAEGKINRQTAKIVFEEMFFNDDSFDIEQYIDKNELWQVDDTEEIRNAVIQVIESNPGTVEQYKSGQTKVLGFFIGQTMKATGGKAKPETVNKIITEVLSKY